jgi:hypothetical protein
MAKAEEKKVEGKEEANTETPKAGPAKGSLKTATVWNGKLLKAGSPAPKELIDWIKSVEKKSGKTVSDYIVE